MDPILEIILKLLASSALLMLFYFALFRSKASYRASRLFLLAVPGLSLVFSLVSVKRSEDILSFSSLVENTRHAAVHPRETAAYAAVSATPVAPMDEVVDTAIEEAPMAAPMPQQAAPLMSDPASRHAAGQTIVEPPATRLSFLESLRLLSAAAYLTVVLIFTVVIALQMLALRRIRRRAEPRIILGSPIYFSSEVRNAFSVMRTIYVNHDATHDKLTIVIRHEKEHIARRHYIDLLVMEIFTLIQWFNPFVWIARRELRNIHEFEADHGTLAGGVRMRDYMLAILEDTTGFIPVMANGLQSSLIKKRFLKMKKPDKIRLRALRVLLTVPFAAIMMLFFAFKPTAAEPTAAASVVAAVSIAEAPAVLTVETLKVEPASDPMLSQAPLLANFVAPTPQDPAPQVSRSITLSPGNSVTINGQRFEIPPMSDEDTAKIRSLSEKIRELNEEIARILESPEIASRIEPVRETMRMLSDSMSMLQTAYFPAGIRTIFERQSVRQVEQKLKKPPHRERDFPAGFDFADHHLSVGPDGIVLDADGKQLPFIEHYLYHDAVAVSADKQVVIDQHKDSYPSKLIRIERSPRETRVTFTLNIYWSSNWLFTAKDACLIDPATGDRYMIRGIADGDQQLGRLGWIYGLQGKAIERTLIFPPLPKEISVIDYDSGNDSEGVTPDTHNAGGQKLQGIRIVDYDPNITPRIIR